MTTRPQRIHLESLTRLARGESSDTLQCRLSANTNPLIERATSAMLGALGISAQQLKVLEWLERVEDAGGIALSLESCRTLAEEFKLSHES